MRSKPESAEQRFRAAFERLKANQPQVLQRGTPVSQNNVAKEAGTDPTALRKQRYPALILEIQAYVEIADRERTIQKERRSRQRQRREDLQATVRRLQDQRDHAQSQLSSAHRAVLELLQENAILKARIEALLPPPTPLRK